MAGTRLDRTEVSVITTWLDPVHKVLDAIPRPVDLFLRDDDVGWEDDRLWALLDMCAEHALPIDLAVIPQAMTSPLARGLIARAAWSPGGLFFHQHGFAHVNHERTGRKFEFGPSRDEGLQKRDIVEGRARLEDHLGTLLDPIFTPPWNRCTMTTALCLAELRFEVLSREARAPALVVPGLVELPVRIDWFAHRRQRRLSRPEFGELVAEAISSSTVVGLMFHHAAMNRDDRDAAAELLSLFADHDGAVVHRMLELARSLRPSSPLPGAKARR